MINEKQKRITKEYRDNYDAIFIRGKNPDKPAAVAPDECPANDAGLVPSCSESQRKRLEAQRGPSKDTLGKGGNE